MKILSYNVRGLGGRLKKLEVRNLVQKHCLDVFCLQETKLDSITAKLCSYLWGNDDFDSCFKQAEGRSGGFIMIWGESKFALSEVIQGRHFVELQVFGVKKRFQWS